VSARRGPGGARRCARARAVAEVQPGAHDAAPGPVDELTSRRGRTPRCRRGKAPPVGVAKNTRSPGLGRRRKARRACARRCRYETPFSPGRGGRPLRLTPSARRWCARSPSSRRSRSRELAHRPEAGGCLRVPGEQFLPHALLLLASMLGRGSPGTRSSHRPPVGARALAQRERRLLGLRAHHLRAGRRQPERSSATAWRERVSYLHRLAQARGPCGAGPSPGDLVFFRNTYRRAFPTSASWSPSAAANEVSSTGPGAASCAPGWTSSDRARAAQRRAPPGPPPRAHRGAPGGFAAPDPLPQ